jgi:hypothetical protein
LCKHTRPARKGGKIGQDFLAHPFASFLPGLHAREIERERATAEQARIEAAEGRHRLETHEARQGWRGGEINRLQGILEGDSKARIVAER